MLHHPAAVDDEDLVGPLQRGKPVGDDDPGTTLQQMVHGAFDQSLGCRVEARRRFVEHDESRVGEEGAGKGEQLALAGGQTSPTRR